MKSVTWARCGMVRLGKVWHGQDGLDQSDQSDQSDENDENDHETIVTISAPVKKRPRPRPGNRGRGQYRAATGRLRGCG